MGTTEICLVNIRDSIAESERKRKRVCRRIVELTLVTLTLTLNGVHSRHALRGGAVLVSTPIFIEVPLIERGPPVRRGLAVGRFG